MAIRVPPPAKGANDPGEPGSARDAGDVVLVERVVARGSVTPVRTGSKLPVARLMAWAQAMTTSRIHFAGLIVPAMTVLAVTAFADPPVAPPRKTPVKLAPASPTTAPAEQEFTKDGWHYRVQRGQAAGGVPWELIVTPSGPDAETWRREEMTGVAGFGKTVKVTTGKIRVKDIRGVSTTEQPRERKILNVTEIPVIKVPDVVWTGWMAKDLQDVVGIHFHELTVADPAQILYTLHKVPADGPDGKPPADYKGKKGSRLEATLLEPMRFTLDQTVVVREDRLKQDLAQKRADHEVGHAGVSHDVLLSAIAGPESWDEAACKGRRGKIVYYWKRERVGRNWVGYRDSSTKLLTARTRVVVAPPTRWSMLLPVPPEKVTQKDVDGFNEAIVLTTAKYAAMDQAEQARFHAEHGEFEANEEGK